MKQRIRFTLIQDGEDVRPFDFDTDEIQIGCDPGRGDNLLIDLPKGRRHVRAKVLRTEDYVELEVVAGPIWLQQSRMEDGDVAELNIGDLLTFGTKKPEGPRLRYEHAREADLVMDDVADWSVSAAPKPRRGSDVEDDMQFEEEVDEYAGLNPYQKAVKWWLKQYRKMTKWRKKAARLNYWWVLAQTLFSKAGKIVGIGVGVAAIGGGYWMQIQQKLEATDQKETAVIREDQAVKGEKLLELQVRELQEQLRQCGCDSATGVNAAAVATTDELLDRFGGEDGFSPERALLMPDKKSRSLADLLSRPFNASLADRRLMPKVLDRVSSASADRDKMNLVIQEASKYGLHEAYTFVPFVESYWCELAVSHTGPRGMMQFTRATAQEAFRRVDAQQADIPHYDWAGERRWFDAYSKKKGISYYRLLASCSELTKADYKRARYGGKTNPDYPNRIDPRDPRTDWEWSTKAAFSWLEHLNQFYANKGFREFDTMMLAITAYNQGQGEVARWIKAAQARYGIKKEAGLSYLHVYAGAMELWAVEKNKEKKRQIREGMDYAPKVVGTYMAAAPKLDERQCR